MKRWLPLMLIALVLAACDSSDNKDYDAPTDLSVEKVDDGKLKLTWSYNSNYEDVVYQIARREGESPWTEGYATTTDDTREYVDEVTTDGYTVYSYKVQALYTDDSTTSSYSAAVAYFSSATAPTDLVLTQSAENTVTLTWTDNAVGEEGYKIDRKEDDNGWVVGYKKLAANIETWADSVVFGASVSYRVYAYSGDSRSAQIEDSITSSFPAPEELTAEQTSQQQIRVRWNSVSADGYQVERRIGAADFDLVSEIADTTYVDYMDIDAGSVAYRVRAYAASGSETLYSSYSIIDTVLFNIVVKGEAALTDPAADVCVENGICYVADTYSGLQLVDVSNEEAPVIGYTYILDGSTTAIKAYDAILYATNYNGGLHIIDATNPASPLGYSYCETIAVPYDVERVLVNEYPYALVADGQAGLLTIALGNDNPANPRIVNRLNTYGICYGLARNGDVLYLADGSDGVKKLDISNPTSPELLAQSGFIGEAHAVALNNGRLYVAAGERGLVVLNAFTLSTLYTIDTQGFAADVAVRGTYVLLADSDRGLVMIDTAGEPGIVAMVDTGGSCNAITVEDNHAYLATDNRLIIVQIGP